MSEIATDPAAIPALPDPILPPPAEAAWAPTDPGVTPVAPVVDTTDLPAVAAALALTVPPNPEVVAPVGGQLLVLPSGFKVGIRNPNAVRNRERRELFKGVADIGEDEDKAEVGLMMTTRIAAMLITEWDVRSVDGALVPFGPVLPVGVDALDDMPIGDAAEIDKVVLVAQKILMPDFSPNASEESPTPPSAG